MIFFSDGAVNHQRPTKIHHQSIITNIIQISVEVFASPIKAQNILLGHPMHHIFGTVYAYYALACGSTLVCSQKLDVNSFFTTVEDQKINVALLLPPILNEIHKISHIVKDVKSLHSILTCGLPVEQDVMISVKEKLELEDIRQVYGSTYACGICTFSKFGCTNYKSVGIPLPAMLMKIVNSETNELCGPYQSGALHVSSPHIFSLIEENEKWQSLTTNANKTYLNTGDFAYYDYAGYIYVICKIKNLIKSKGKMVRPEKIESLVLENPAVKDCAIIGSCDKSVTDAPTAFVVKSEKYPHLAPSDIRRHIPAKLTDLRGGVFFVDKIPRSDSGKILRRLLKDNWYRNRLIGLQKSQSSMALLGINTANASKSRQSPELGKSKSRNVIHLSHNR